MADLGRIGPGSARTGSVVTMRWCVAFWLHVVLLVLFPIATRADHVLLQSGHALFNVSVDNVETTWTTLPYVRHKDGFEYRFETDEVFDLEGRGNYHWVADWLCTTTVFGKRDARRFAEQKGWLRYSPPPPRRYTPPTPTPIPTPTPLPREVVRPTDLADPALPLDQRLSAQLQLFLNDQLALADRIVMARKFNQIEEKAAVEERVRLLERQARILQENYPVSEERVKSALEALRHQGEVVKQKGRFFHEQ